MPDNKALPDSKKIKALLPENDRGIDIFVYESIDSTNTEAKRLINNKNNMLILAGTQTAGRGRKGKSFFSPEKTGVYMSIVIHPCLPLEKAARATTAAAVAVCEAIEALTDKKPQIKWVNDVFADGKKICGILTEAVCTEKPGIADDLIIGIGINVSTEVFPNELKESAGSLGDGTIDKNSLIAQICKRTLSFTKDLDNPEIIEKYKKRCFVLGREISYERSGKTFKATAVDIDKDGSLIIQLSGGERQALRSGEISIKL